MRLLEQVAGCAIALTVCAAAFGQTPSAAGQAQEIARGTSWVSPYWGYSAPKLVFDGTRYYTPLLWGMSPNEARWAIAAHADGSWKVSTEHAGVYQPPVLLLDAEKRLIVIHNLEEKPPVILRAKSAGDAEQFDVIAPPADVANSYYIGAAIRGNRVYLACVTIPSYSMLLTSLDLATGAWTPARVIAEGQIETKPKTAWTYPILVPVDGGVHVVASNCPDGGDGNTYNQLWHCFVPDDAAGEISKSMILEGKIGCMTYATDFVFDAAGGMHIVYMANMRKYGDVPPEGDGKPGLYHAYREANGTTWATAKVAPLCIGGFYRNGDALSLIAQEEATLFRYQWNATTKSWDSREQLLAKEAILAGPSFMDVVREESGSAPSPGIALVTDGLLAPVADAPAVRIVWSLLPG